MGDTVRTVGFEGKFTPIIALAPQVIADATPVLSAAIDLTSAYPRARFLLVAHTKETTPTAHTVTFTVTESATSGGSYAAATTSGTIVLDADGAGVLSFRRNRAKPFVKVTATGSHADVDQIVSASILAITDRL